ncbi:MAG: histidine kinase [Caulobacteraceae bacterium]|nr:histidine kinase [Caulobacteraceae bacterium]
MHDGHDIQLAAAIIDSAKDYAIFTIDAAGVITSWSSGAAAVIGYSRDEAVGMHFGALFTEPDRSADAPAAEIARALREGRAEDTRWHKRKDGELFWANGVTMVMRDGDSPSLLKVIRDETPSRRADEQRVLLLHELNHRIKNTLATVQSIADQTLRGAKVDVRVRTVLAQRLRAVSEAHDVLVDQNWAGADLMAIVAGALEPFMSAYTDRLAVGGPDIRLAPNEAVAISLVLHELATNAVKYGALSTAEGRIRVEWNLAQNGRGERQMNLLWAEEGGPAVEPPDHRGFGARLIDRLFEQETNGEAKIDFAPQGLRCSMSLSLSDRADAAPLNPTIERPVERATAP